MGSIPRRDFLIGMSAGVGVSLLSARRARAAASDTVRHAVVGLGGQGRRHATTFAKFPDCQVVAVADVDPERRDRTRSALEEFGTVAAHTDFRHILDDASIDSVSIATPDHWHTLIALHALQAGKHVYIEKPCSHNVREARILEAVADRTKKCVQHGTQGRSGAGIQDAMRMLHAGELGKARVAKAINHQFRAPIGRAPVSEPPAGTDYDLWLGPAPLHPFTRNRWHYNWHWFWDYGCGDIGNDGIHQIDEARWGLNAGVPKRVVATGGQLFYDDDHETPDTQTVTFEYEDCHLIYEMRLWTKYPLEGHDNGVVFYCDGGTLEIGRNGCEVTRTGEPKKKVGGGADFDGHLRNYLDCIKEDNPAGLNAPIKEGAISTALCHYGNIGSRVGRALHIDDATGLCRDDEEANALMSRTYRKGFELPKVS